MRHAPHFGVTPPTEANRIVPDEPQTNFPAFMLESIGELKEATRQLARQIESKSRIVDEYRTQPLAGDLETTLSLKPQFERLYERIEHIIITGPSQGSAGANYQGSATAPAASANILLITAGNLPPPGNYTVSWVLGLSGTPAAPADVNNVKATFGTPVLATSVNEGVVGSYPQQPFQVTIPQGNANNIPFKAIGAATAGSVYSVAADFVPAGGFPVTLQLGDRVWNLVIPATGILEISPKNMILSPQDTRALTATFAGNYSLELTGYADVRNRP